MEDDAQDEYVHMMIARSLLFIDMPVFFLFQNQQTKMASLFSARALAKYWEVSFIRNFYSYQISLELELSMFIPHLG